MRNVYENWLAIWYLSKFPGEADRWLNPSWQMRPPTAETMKNKIDHPSKDMKAKLKSLNAELCLFAHTDPIAILPLLGSRPGETTVHFGVTYNEEQFKGAAYSIAVWIGNMLSTLSMWITDNDEWHEKNDAVTNDLLGFVEQCNEEFPLTSSVEDTNE
jgi:hypothetical protein